MTNRLLWFTILIVGIFYFSMPEVKKVNRSFISVFKFNDKVESKLALIPTSPRWKYPFQNHNASVDADGDYVFPPSTLPIVSIKGKEKSLFSYKNGIYIRGLEEWDAQSMDLSWWDWPANYKNRGKKWERKVKIDFIGFAKEEQTQYAGIRINGNATRAFPQKSLRLVFREEYQKGGINNIFFTNEEEEKYRTLLLRNGGNDWDRAMLRDVLVAKLSKNLAVETQDAEACNVYINGEYWGIHYLRPKIDDDFLSNRYAIDKENICIIESPLDVYRGDSIGLIEFRELLDFVIEKDMSDSGEYAIFSQRFDIVSFIDYLVVQMFIVNTDWPQNNWMVWKDLSNKHNDGKWKWILKDTDYGLGFFDANAYTFDMQDKVKGDKGTIGILFTSLMNNENFKSLFEERSQEIRNNEWNVNNFNKSLDSLQNNLQEEMPYQIDRWRTHLSVEDWESEVNEVKLFYTNRMKQLYQ